MKHHSLLERAQADAWHSWWGKAAKSLGDTAVSCGGLRAGATAVAPSFVQRQDGLWFRC